MPQGSVLLLLPDTTNKLLVAWKGPFTVIERHNSVNYVINYDGVHKQFHSNLLKKYHRRANVNFVQIPNSTGTISQWEPALFTLTINPLSFILSVAAVVVPLTDELEKGSPEQLVWSAQICRDFEMIL